MDPDIEEPTSIMQFLQLRTFILKVIPRFCNPIVDFAKFVILIGIEYEEVAIGVRNARENVVKEKDRQK